MSKRKIRDEGDARRCLADQMVSGLPLAAWAAVEGIDGRSLNSWRLNLARRGQQQGAAPRMVELVAAAAAPAKYTIRCGRLEVEVGEGFDQDTLFRLLQVVAA